MANLVAHQVFKALSEPLRLRIAVLLTEGEACVCDLTHVLAKPQSTVSRHMARLKTVGLVSSRRKGKWVHYDLRSNSGPLADAMSKYLHSARSAPPYRKDLARLIKHRDQRSCE